MLQQINRISWEIATSANKRSGQSGARRTEQISDDAWKDYAPFDQARIWLRALALRDQVAEEEAEHARRSTVGFAIPPHGLI